MNKIAPSVLGADFLNLGSDIEMLNKHSDYIHLDIMDGTFVPNISFGFPVIEAISRTATVPMDAHLMVVHPERWFARLAEAGVRMVSFHQEERRHGTSSCIEEIHRLGMKAGIAINPDIPVRKLFDYVGSADYFLIMSVYAGFGGQKFIYESLDKIEALKKELIKQKSDALIEVDGGVNPGNARALREAGADILVAGSSVFTSANPADVIEELRKA